MNNEKEKRFFEKISFLFFVISGRLRIIKNRKKVFYETDCINFRRPRKNRKSKAFFGISFFFDCHYLFPAGSAKSKKKVLSRTVFLSPEFPTTLLPEYHPPQISAELLPGILGKKAHCENAPNEILLRVPVRFGGK